MVIGSKSDFMCNIFQRNKLYAGSLDDPSLFKPKMAILTRGHPAWAIIPPILTEFEDLPPRRAV